jgi:hypothetical protein
MRLMAYAKTIVCFANSQKRGGRCVAGKEFAGGRPGPWVRPVSGRIDRELYDRDRDCGGGRDPRLLDVREVDCERPSPLGHQPENHLIRGGRPWRIVGALAWEALPEWLDHPADLWGRGDRSEGYVNNRVRADRGFGASLHLIAAPRLTLEVGRKTPEEKDRRVVKGGFEYRDVPYRLAVTDPEIEDEYLRRADGEYEIRDAVLCLSLGEEFRGHYYKLIAAVLHKARFA